MGESEDDIASLKRQLSELKAQLSAMPAKEETVGRDYSKQKYTPKNPLGMKDYMPHEMVSSLLFCINPFNDGL